MGAFFVVELVAGLVSGSLALLSDEAVRRAGSEPEVSSTPMLVVGALGLGVNVAAIALLRAGARESLNVRGAYLEVVADAAGSVGVIVAGVLVALTGDAVWATAVAVAIGVFVAVRAVPLGRQGVPGVEDVHDLHAWTLTSGMLVATAHLVVADGTSPQLAVDAARRVLREQHGIEHATVQVGTHATAECHEIDW